MAALGETVFESRPALLANPIRQAGVVAGYINVTIRDRYFSAAMTAPRSAFAELIRTGDENGRGRKFVVPAEVKKSVNIAANLLWDNPEYVLGWPPPGLTEKQAAKVPERHKAFIARLRALPETVRADAGVSA
jgi:CRISPR-associated protein, Csd1 family